MRLIVDTNILFSYFWKKSTTRKILMKQGLELISPEYALEEIRQHEQEIMKKTGLRKEEFSATRIELVIAVTFIPLKEYQDKLKAAAQSSPDPNDVDFFALALHMQAPIWSNDAILKQSNVQVLSTADLLSNREFSDIIEPIDDP